ncbi:hypothetical protein [uncultured Chitinophaga sp.]|uniref:hypothetical protein n=1 Tax=uncultured Chitinophaga sp. TaxID=339340 RepID=UPI00260B5D7F|nr:hypothetical protein [uncultured Chitinophaga sp.]
MLLSPLFAAGYVLSPIDQGGLPGSYNPSLNSIPAATDRHSALAAMAGVRSAAKHGAIAGRR